MMADEDGIERAVRTAEGAAKEIAGKITGDARLEAEGRAQKRGGTQEAAADAPPAPRRDEA